MSIILNKQGNQATSKQEVDSSFKDMIVDAIMGGCDADNEEDNKDLVHFDYEPHYVWNRSELEKQSVDDLMGFYRQNR